MGSMANFIVMRRGAVLADINVSGVMTGADVACPTVSSGDTAWILVSTALVLFMTPGLAFFYGGLVPRSSVLTIMFQILVSIATTSVVWAICGFSLSFSDNGQGVYWGATGYIGNPIEHPFLQYMDLCDVWEGTRVPALLFAGYQMMFAVIAPALITGAFADRLLFPAYLIFIIVWVPMVYCPFVYWIWNPDGFLLKWGVVDFAGGIVVHISAGFAALASVFVVGPRKYVSEAHKEISKVPHNRVFVALGTGMLWLGWFGFNGGSALASSGRAAYAVVNSTVAASTAMFTWMIMEWYHLGKPQLVGACVGAVCGLATITGAAGYVRPWAAMLIGFLAAPFCFGCVLLRTHMGWDDALDVWGLHGMGGLFGSLLTGLLADQDVGGVHRSGELFGKQVAACGLTVVYSFTVSYAILRIIGMFMPLVPPIEVVVKGLDATLHGEHAYDHDHIAQSGLADGSVSSHAALSAYAAGAFAASAKVLPSAPAEGLPAAEAAHWREEIDRLVVMVRELQQRADSIKPAGPAAAAPAPGPSGMADAVVKMTDADDDDDDVRRAAPFTREEARADGAGGGARTAWAGSTEKTLEDKFVAVR